MIVLAAVSFVELFVFFAVNGAANDYYRTYVERTQNVYSCMVAFIWIENIKSSAVLILSGFVPSFLGSLYGITMTSKSLISTLKQMMFGLPLRTIILGIIPHGIFELIGLFLSFALSCIISKEVTLGILRKVTGKEIAVFGNQVSLLGIRKSCSMIVSCWIFVLIPLLLFAAVIEVFISPIVLSALA